MAFSRSKVPTYASFSYLAGNGRRFRVPRFQSDYQWTTENRAVSLLEECSSTDPQNHERAEDIRRAFVSSRDPLSLHYRSKLTLNRADDNFHHHTLAQLRQPHVPSRLPEANAALWQTFEFFRSRLREKFPAPDIGGYLAQFIQNIVGSRLFVLRIPVDDDLAAYTVCETLDARGVELTASDLLKNYLMSLVAPLSEADLEQVLSQ